MQDVLTFAMQLAIAGAVVWLMVKAIQVYFNRRADRTGDFGITRLPERDEPERDRPEGSDGAQR